MSSGASACRVEINRLPPRRPASLQGTIRPSRRRPRRGRWTMRSVFDGSVRGVELIADLLLNRRSQSRDIGERDRRERSGGLRSSARLHETDSDDQAGQLKGRRRPRPSLTFRHLAGTSCSGRLRPHVHSSVSPVGHTTRTRGAAADSPEPDEHPRIVRRRVAAIGASAPPQYRAARSHEADASADHISRSIPADEPQAHPVLPLSNVR